MYKPSASRGFADIFKVKCLVALQQWLGVMQDFGRDFMPFETVLEGLCLLRRAGLVATLLAVAATLIFSTSQVGQ